MLFWGVVVTSLATPAARNPPLGTLLSPAAGGLAPLRRA